MLSKAQRDVLRRLAVEGAELHSDVDTSREPYVMVTPVPITTTDVDALDAAGLIEVTLYYDGPRIYEITDAGRAALEEAGDGD